MRFTHLILLMALLGLSVPAMAQEQEADQEEETTQQPETEQVQVSEQQQAAELTKKLNNPIASLISFPVNFNFDDNIGPQIMQGRIGVRHWYARMGYGPDATQLTARLTLLWPK